MLRQTVQRQHLVSGLGLVWVGLGWFLLAAWAEWVCEGSGRHLGAIPSFLVSGWPPKSRCGLQCSVERTGARALQFDQTEQFRHCATGGATEGGPPTWKRRQRSKARFPTTTMLGPQCRCNVMYCVSRTWLSLAVSVEGCRNRRWELNQRDCRLAISSFLCRTLTDRNLQLRRVGRAAVGAEWRPGHSQSFKRQSTIHWLETGNVHGRHRLPSKLPNWNEATAGVRLQPHLWHVFASFRQAAGNCRQRQQQPLPSGLSFAFGKE